MKKIIAVVCFALFAMPVLAATQQQERTKACNSAATKKGLKGDKHKAYIKACVSAKTKKKPETAAAAKKKDARPATSAARSPATTAPAQPSAASAANPPAANAPAASLNSAAEKKRLRCDEIARQSNVSPSSSRDFMAKCMAG
jgi:hypothetical protein